MVWGTQTFVCSRSDGSCGGPVQAQLLQQICGIWLRKTWQDVVTLDPRAGGVLSQDWSQRHTRCGVMEKGTLDGKPETLFEISQQPLERTSCVSQHAGGIIWQEPVKRQQAGNMEKTKTPEAAFFITTHCLHNSSIPQDPLCPERPPCLSRQPLIIDEGGAP